MRRILGSWWVAGGIATLLLVLVFCLGLPFFVDWLRPWWVRLLIGGVLVAIYLLIGWLGVRKRRKAARAIEAELVTPSAADQESAAVAARMAEALTALRGRSKSRDYLYTKPWYVIIGPPGAGKTTALLNSGLMFPFADQSVKGVGGTRNLDFWFADEAALVDTAGRYTTQESDPTADAEGWKSFLGQLRKHRPLSPVNGIIVAIGVDELLSVDRAGLDRHASLVRRRLAELRSTLEVAVPAYLLITKADLIAGFVEYYDDLDVEGRRAVLGATLPAENRTPGIDDVVEEFDRLINAQSARQAKRLFEEVDHVRRSLILGFPSQLAALRNRVARFVEGAFLSGDTPSANIRGFYLTSGVQAGAPLDRILAGVAETFQTTTDSRRGSGRTYFLNRLLTEVMFKEAGLVRADPAARKRQQIRLAGGLAAVGAVALLVLGLWTLSFVNNRAFLADLNKASHEASAQMRQVGIDLVEVRETDPDLEQSLAALRALRNLPQGYAQQAAGQPGWSMRFGLYQSSHADRAAESYRDGLRRILLPRVLLRIEQYIRANAGNPMSLYQPLKVYLMLGGWGPMDKAVVKSWVASDWAQEAYPGSDRAPLRKELAQHLDAMLEDEGLGASWGARRKAPLDGAVIASARGALQTLSLADLAYAVLRQNSLATSGAPWRASAALAAGDAQAFANGEDVLQAEVPYLFTRMGHEKAYQIGLTTVAADFQKELWVLGEGASAEGTRMQMSQIRANVARLYARDYIAAWERIAKMPRPANYFSDAAALGAFTKTPSPLKVLLLEVRKNTTFAGGTGAAGKLAADKLSQSRYGRYIQGAAKIADDGNAYDAGTEIANYFQPLHDYVGDPKEPGPLDEFIGQLKQAGAAMTSARLAGGSMGSEAAQGQMAMSMGAVATAAGAAPALLKDFVMSAAGGGAKESVTTAQGALSEVYTGSVLPACRLATAEKYPFFGTSEEDASLVDVQQVFAMGGSLDSFFEQRVMPLLDTSGPIWRWNAQLPVTASLSPSSPDEFAKARKLRDLLVAGLTVRFEPRFFGGEVGVVDLTAGGNQYRFATDETEARPVIWSAQGNVPEASLTMYSVQADSDKLTRIARLTEGGPWALFRLMDHARLENAGPSAVLATFGSGGQSVAFKVSLPDKQNPFVRGAGVWSFRCPVSL